MERVLTLECGGVQVDVPMDRALQDSGTLGNLFDATQDIPMVHLMNHPAHLAPLLQALFGPQRGVEDVVATFMGPEPSEPTALANYYERAEDVLMCADFLAHEPLVQHMIQFIANFVHKKTPPQLRHALGYADQPGHV